MITACSALVFLAILTTGRLVAALAADRWVSLEGQPMTAGNPVETDGLIRKFNAPALRVTRTMATKPQGTILLLPGGGYHVLDTVSEGSLTAAELNRFGYLLETGPKPGAGPFNTKWPGFAAHRADRRSRFAAQQAKEREVIVFLGDSITEQWDIPRFLPGLKVANRGIAGDTTRGMFCRMEEDVLNLQPKAIVLLGGINDLFHAPLGTPDAIAMNVRSILEQIQKTRPGTPVFLCEILPSKSMTDGTVRAANLAVDKVLADFPNVHRVKTHDSFLDSRGKLQDSLFTDGTHFTPAGYEALAKSMKAAQIP